MSYNVNSVSYAKIHALSQKEGVGEVSLNNKGMATCLPKAKEVVEDATAIPAMKILLAGEFQKMRGDDKRRKVNGYSIGEAQGTRQLRKAARRYSAHNPLVFSPVTLRKIAAIHRKNFRILQLKRLGHALGINTQVKLEDGTFFQLDGFSESFALPMIASSVLEYAQQEKSLISQENAKWVSDHLNGTISNANYEKGIARKIRNKIRDHYNKEVISISGGYDWHGTHIIIYRRYLFYCNRGYGSDLFPGIRVYKINKPFKITSECIVSLICRHELNREQWDRDFKPYRFKNNQSLDFICILKQADQQTGNCTYVSTKCAVKVLLALKCFEESPQTPLDAISIRAAFQLTAREYKGWSLFDKNLVINDLLHDAANLQNGSTYISAEEFRKIFTLVQVKIMRNPHKYRETRPSFFKINLE